MRVVCAVAVSSVVAAFAGVATAAAPIQLAVTVHGTMTYRYHDQFTTKYPNGGDGCTVVVTQESHDTLTFATDPDRPIKLTLVKGMAAATAPVDYALHVLPATSQTTSEPTGVGPDGGPCPAYTLPIRTEQCGTYKGSLPLRVEIDGLEVTVSSAGAAFKPVACGGSSPTKTYIVEATGTSKANRSGRVVGQGHRGNDDSAFAATLVPR